MVVGKIPTTRMSGAEVRGCVELVSAAFSEAASLAANLCRKQKRWKGERDYHEQLLSQVLQQSVAAVQKAYDDGANILGSVFTTGDDEARERLLCIAIELNAELVQPLHTACTTDKSAAELTKLHEFAITARHDAVLTLGSLSRRLDHLRPLAVSKFSPDSSVCGDDPNADRRFVFPPDGVPSLPEKSGLRRMLTSSASNAPAPHRRMRSSEAPAPRLVTAIPKPLTVNTAIAARAPPPVKQSPAHTRGHSRTMSESSKGSNKSANRTSLSRLEGLQHPDMPNFRMGPTEPKPPKSPKMPKHNKRNSISSIAQSTTGSTRSGTSSAFITGMCAVPYTPTSAAPSPRAGDRTSTASSLVMGGSVPSLPYTATGGQAPNIPHTQFTPFTIAEVREDSASTKDYDAESVYSQHSANANDDDHSSNTSSSDQDPGTPVTDSGSSARHSRSSASEAPTPTAERSVDVTIASDKLTALPVRPRAVTNESHGSTATTDSGGKRKSAWSRVGGGMFKGVVKVTIGGPDMTHRQGAFVR